MLEGVQVNTETMLEVALAKLTNMQRENMMLEAALNDAHKELAHVRTLIPADEEVKEEADGV